MSMAAASFSLSQLQGQSNDEFDIPDIKLAPEFKTRRGNRYHINELLQFHDREFIRNAYRAILKREPDEAGLNSYLGRLRSGRRNKIDILASLRYSAEGHERGVTIEGLGLPALTRSFVRLPVIGYLYEMVVGLLRLPVSIYHRRQFESHVMAQQQQMADHLNRLTHTVRGLQPFVAEIRSLRAQSNDQLQRMSDVQRTSERHATLISEHDNALSELSRQDEVLKTRLDREAELLAIQSDRVDQTHEDLRDQRLELSAQRARLMSALGTSRARTASAGADRDDDNCLEPLLTLLEDRFRGERNELKQRLEFYLPYLTRENITDDILDVGCGRGEWLELLKERGLTARGVDSNQLMVERCQTAGLEATSSDLFDYFAAVPDSSLNAITAFHIIEHLEFQRLVELIDHSIRALRPSGLLILETPNPENVIVATRTFYFDPTHLKPLPAELVQFVLNARGLLDVEVVSLHPLNEARAAGDSELASRVNDLFYGPMDYGIIARKK